MTVNLEKATFLFIMVLRTGKIAPKQHNWSDKHFVRIMNYLVLAIILSTWDKRFKSGTFEGVFFKSTYNRCLIGTIYKYNVQLVAVLTPQINGTYIKEGVVTSPPALHLGAAKPTVSTWSSMQSSKFTPKPPNLYQLQTTSPPSTE